MATQLNHTDFAYAPAPTPRPNIRVAFIAGEATAAVHDAMTKLPADTRDGTLDDLVWDQDLAISNTKLPKFADGLAMSDMYTRLAWAAIEDLARIAGVSLAEQGA